MQVKLSRKIKVTTTSGLIKSMNSSKKLSILISNASLYTIYVLIHSKTTATSANRSFGNRCCSIIYSSPKKHDSSCESVCLTTHFIYTNSPLLLWLLYYEYHYTKIKEGCGLFYNNRVEKEWWETIKQNFYVW